MVDDVQREALLNELKRVSKLMDSSIGIPFTKYTFGFDSLIGLLPIGGDVAGLIVSAYLVLRSRQLGASRKTLLKMIGNIVADTTLGAVPIAGDAFDVFFKANQRNVQLLLAEFSTDESKKPR